MCIATCHRRRLVHAALAAPAAPVFSRLHGLLVPFVVALAVLPGRAVQARSAEAATAALPKAPPPPRSGAQACRRLPAKARARVDFAATPLAVVARAVSCWTGANLVVSPGLSGRTVTFVAARSVARADLLPLLRAALRVHGLGLTLRRGHGVIAPLRPTLRGGRATLTLRHVDAAAAAKALLRLSGIHVRPLDRGNAVLLPADAGDARAARRWLGWLDAPGGSRRIYLVRVHTRPPRTLAPLIRQALARKVRDLRVVPDRDRLIVVVRPKHWPLVHAAIQRLDRDPRRPATLSAAPSSPLRNGERTPPVVHRSHPRGGR